MRWFTIQYCGYNEVRVELERGGGGERGGRGEEGKMGEGRKEECGIITE